MSLLQILLSILGIIFIIWMYAILFTDIKQIPNFSRLKASWRKNFQDPSFSLIRFIFHKFIQFLSFLKNSIKKFFKFLAELTVEILFNLILRGIWLIMKNIFLAIVRIFD